MSGEANENDLELKVMKVMLQHPKGVSNTRLYECLPSVDRKLLIDQLNKLNSEHKIQVYRKENQELVFRLNQSSIQKYQGTDIEEKLIFDAVERAGNKGISNRDLKTQCHMVIQQINKILKSLEARRLVKCVSSTSRKKLYMLYDVEPDVSVTGGNFYTGDEFESEFVNVLADQCYKYLAQAKAVAEKLSDPILQKNASFKSSKEICTYINSLNISKVNLSLKDIERILGSLVYDDKVETCVTLSKTNSSKDSGTENMYRVSKPLISGAGIMMVPCGVCPVYESCRIGGDISPATCVYMKEWLNF